MYSKSSWGVLAALEISPAIVLFSVICVKVTIIHNPASCAVHVLSHFAEESVAILCNGWPRGNDSVVAGG
jgi:hypothetical protein